MEGTSSVKIVGTVDLEASADHEERRGSLDHLHAVRCGTAVPLRDQQEPGLFGAGRPSAEIGEVVGPGVDELQDVVAIMGVGDVEDQWTPTHVTGCDGVEGVVVR